MNAVLVHRILVTTGRSHGTNHRKQLPQLLCQFN
uniref:Uncharacterized protein n=1 Tax=Zea mays TaxID=4577 RepID=B4FG19_MAIZE|nr:unknown [Zea mays]